MSGAINAISHLSDKSIFCKVSSQAEPWMVKTAAFHGRISAGIGCSHKMLIYVFTELGATGSPEGHLACNAPLGACGHRRNIIKNRNEARKYFTQEINQSIGSGSLILNMVCRGGDCAQKKKRGDSLRSYLFGFGNPRSC